MPSYTAEALALRENAPLSRSYTRQEMRARRLAAAAVSAPPAAPAEVVKVVPQPVIVFARKRCGRPTTWTDDRVEELKRLRKAGLKASQIAVELKVTENAVVTQVYKLRALARGLDSTIPTYWTPEVKKRMAAVAASLWQRPDFRRKQEQSSRGASVSRCWQSPDFRQRQRQSRKLLWQDPTFRSKVLRALEERRRIVAAQFAVVAKRYATIEHVGFEGERVGLSGRSPVPVVMASQLDAVDFALSIERLPQALQKFCAEVLDGGTIDEAAAAAGIAEKDLSKALAHIRAAFGH